MIPEQTRTVFDVHDRTVINTGLMHAVLVVLVVHMADVYRPGTYGRGVPGPIYPGILLLG